MNGKVGLRNAAAEKLEYHWLQKQVHGTADMFGILPTTCLGI